MAVEENAGEDITSEAKASKTKKASDDTEIDLEEEQKTEAYQEKLKISKNWKYLQTS